MVTQRRNIGGIIRGEKKKETVVKLYKKRKMVRGLEINGKEDGDLEKKGKETVTRKKRERRESNDESGIKDKKKEGGDGVGSKQR